MREYVSNIRRLDFEHKVIFAVEQNAFAAVRSYRYAHLCKQYDAASINMLQCRLKSLESTLDVAE